MAAKKSSGPARGASLVKKAIESSTLTSPEAVPAGILKKLRMPNDEKLTAALKAFLTYDGASLGFSFDDEEPEFESMALDELVEQELGEEHLAAFGEAAEILDGDCVVLEGEGDTCSFLYFGEADESGEYPVITLDPNGARVAGFVPFDVWIAQRLGAIPAGFDLGGVPEEYVAATQALADANGDGRRSFASQARDVKAGDDEDDEEG